MHTGLHRPLLLKQVDALKISRQLALKGGQVVGPTY